MVERRWLMCGLGGGDGRCQSMFWRTCCRGVDTRACLMRRTAHNHVTLAENIGCSRGNIAL
jgi:hypothetical protein